jgi:exodeoxyribonuclease VII small subunit
MGKNKLNYTSAITELEAIVNEIESGEADVDVLAEKVRRASDLIRFCNERLKATQGEVDKILVDLEEKEAAEEESEGEK